MKENRIFYKIMYLTRQNTVPGWEEITMTGN